MVRQISGRNQLSGKVTEVQLGDVVAEVTVQVGDNLVDAIITKKSAVALDLKVGDTVTAVIKATEVMIVKDMP